VVFLCVTDGAAYIDSSFSSALKTCNARHIVCWWHQRQNVLKGIGFRRKLGRTFLKIIYATNEQELYESVDEAIKIANEEETPIKSFDKLLRNWVNCCLKNLDVFTGATVTNSYSECVNRLLRRTGLTTGYPMLTVLRYLNNFCLQHYRKRVPSFSLDSDLRVFIGDDVLRTITAGALWKVKKNYLKACKCCKVLSGGSAIEETLKFHRGRGDRPCFKKMIWKVNWKDGKIPECSCKATLYGGVPCQYRMHHSDGRVFEETIKLAGLQSLDLNPRYPPGECFL